MLIETKGENGTIVYIDVERVISIEGDAENEEFTTVVVDHHGEDGTIEHSIDEPVREFADRVNAARQQLIEARRVLLVPASAPPGG